MSKLFRRHSTVRCFFCLSAVPYPVNIRQFKCPSCSCWNRYDERGEIISDEPAMHEEHLNSNAFAKRGSPSKDRLPNIYGPGPFCHSCQTNQMLLVNLLSNYLPEPDSQEYSSRVEMLPAYRESLHTRYPPVCETCAPLVEDEIKRKEHMARVHALGGWLNKGKDRQRQLSAEPVPTKEDKARGKIRASVKSTTDVKIWWKVRGALWAGTIAVSVIGNLGAAYGHHPFRHLNFLQPVLPFFAFISILWSAWDPTYRAVHRAKQQGRDVRIHGKKIYNMLQMTTWFSRLLTTTLFSATLFRLSPYPAIRILVESPAFHLSMFSIELVVLIGSLFTLRIHQPPSIRLVDTSVHNRLDRSRSSTPAPAAGTESVSRSLSSSSSAAGASGSRGNTPGFVPESGNDLLSTLSLSSKPVLPRPVFGQSSLHGSQRQPQQPQPSSSSEEGEEMDWQPTNPSNPFDSSRKRPAASSTDGDPWTIRPQRFFAPEKPTGLEGLFESTKLQDEPMVIDSPSYHGLNGGADRRRRRNCWHTMSNHMRNWSALYALSLAVAAGIALGGRYYWARTRMAEVTITYTAARNTIIVVETPSSSSSPTSSSSIDAQWADWNDSDDS